MINPRKTPLNPFSWMRRIKAWRIHATAKARRGENTRARGSYRERMEFADARRLRRRDSSSIAEREREKKKPARYLRTVICNIIKRKGFGVHETPPVRRCLRENIGLVWRFFYSGGVGFKLWALPETKSALLRKRSLSQQNFLWSKSVQGCFDPSRPALRWAWVKW